MVQEVQPLPVNSQDQLSLGQSGAWPKETGVKPGLVLGRGLCPPPTLSDAITREGGDFKESGEEQRPPQASVIHHLFPHGPRWCLLLGVQCLCRDMVRHCHHSSHSLGPSLPRANTLSVPKCLLAGSFFEASTYRRASAWQGPVVEAVGPMLPCFTCPGGRTHHGWF